MSGTVAFRTTGLARGGAAFTDPTSLPNLVQWLDASDSYSGSTILDKSGNGYHVSGGISSSGTQNGKTYAYLTHTGGDYAQTSSFSLTSNAATLCWVGTGDWDRQFSIGNGSTDSGSTDSCLWISHDSGGTWYNSSNLFSNSISTSVFALYTVIRNGASWVMRKNGSQIATASTSSANFNATVMCLNAQATTLAGKGDTRHADSALYSDVKSGTNLSNLESYFIAKWGL